MEKGNLKTEEELITEAYEKLTEQEKWDLDYDTLELSSWTQTWPSTACGFPGLGGCAMTDARTAIVRSCQTDAVVVFHGDNFAYIVFEPTEDFEEAVEKERLQGAHDFTCGTTYDASRKASSDE